METRFTNEQRGGVTLEPNVTDEAKVLIKSKRDVNENLSQEDFDNPIATKRHLQDMLHK